MDSEYRSDPGQSYQPEDSNRDGGSPPATAAQPASTQPQWGWAPAAPEQPYQMAYPQYASPHARRGSWKDKFGSVAGRIKSGATVASSPAASWQATSNEALIAAQNAQPQAVVKVMSVRGLENLLMTLNLWLVDAAFLIVALAIINGEANFDILSIPIATIMVCLPLFALFFIRLKRAELANPALRYDPSKRRMSHITQVFTYLVCVFNLISFFYNVLQKIAGDSSASIGKTSLNMIVILIFMGGIFLYYWFDEHKVQGGR